MSDNAEMMWFVTSAVSVLALLFFGILAAYRAEDRSNEARGTSGAGRSDEPRVVTATFGKATSAEDGERRLAS